MDTIKRTELMAEIIVNQAIGELETGLDYADQELEFYAQRHYDYADALMGLISMEYNAVNLHWPVDLPESVQEDIRKMLELHRKLQNRLCALDIVGDKRMP